MVEFKQVDRNNVYYGGDYVSDFLKSKTTLKREKQFARVNKYFLVDKELVTYTSKKYDVIRIEFPKKSKKYKGMYFWIDKNKVHGYDILNLFRYVEWRNSDEVIPIYRVKKDGSYFKQSATIKEIAKEFLNYQKVNDIFYDMYINNSNETLVKLIDEHC